MILRECLISGSVTLGTSLVICGSPVFTPLVLTSGMNPLKVEVPRLLFFSSWGFPREAEAPSALSRASTPLPTDPFEKHLRSPWDGRGSAVYLRMHPR